jgi:two-component system phosphate regulon sensor histidine kinase PhoR
MVLRLLSFMVFQLLAIGLASWLVPFDDTWLTALIATFSASLVWIFFDTLRGMRVLRWLQVGDGTDAMQTGGLWGEAQDRFRRLLRVRDRQKKESELRLQDFLAALQASPNGVVLLDAQARIEWFNETASEHFGIEPGRDILQHFGNLVRDPDFANYFAARDFREDVVIFGREHSILKPVRLSVHLHPYGDGRILLLSRDITEKEQADAMRRDFVANVSHEIRTPLTVLMGFVETLQTLPLSEQECQEYLGLMSQQAQRMQSLVSDLLMLSRLEGSSLPPIRAWVSVQSLLVQCQQEAQALSALLWGQAQSLVFEIQADSELAGSESELHSAFFNLISNAVRYTPADKNIVVRWQELSDGRAVFSVQDKGHGIAPEHIPRLTERFYRVDRSRSRETGGTGLGLAIAKHVAQRHGGELHIDSVLGQGSVFSITFSALRVRPRLLMVSDILVEE